MEATPPKVPPGICCRGVCRNISEPFSGDCVHSSCPGWLQHLLPPASGCPLVQGRGGGCRVGLWGCLALSTWLSMETSHPVLSRGVPRGEAKGPPGACWQRDISAFLLALVAVTILSSLSAQLQEHPENSRPEPTACLEPYTLWSRTPAGSSQESPRAPWLWPSCSQGTSSFDEPITEPALRLPTGNRKVLFVTGCWKGHGVLLPLLFLARALSPSDGKRSRALGPGHAVSVRPPPRRLVPGAVRALRGGCSVPAHAARALHGPEKPLEGGGSRVP